MQSMSIPTGDHNPNGHDPDEILAALQGRGGSRMLSFRYDLLSGTGLFIQPLTNIQSCKISQNWLADIKRTAVFTVQDTGEINYLSDTIRPWIRLHLPPYGPDDWVEWAQGVFGLSSPTRHADGAEVVTRQVDAYDMLQKYADDRVSSRYVVSTGTSYTNAIGVLLGLSPFSRRRLTFSGSLLPGFREWDPGTSKLRIINDLLAAINFESLSFAEDGTAVTQRYISPQERAEEYTYADDQNGVMIPEVDQTLDLFSIPNRWTLVVSEPDQPMVISTYTNTDPGSLTSTVRRGRIITDFRTEIEAADQAALDAKVQRLAFQASQVYEAIEFQTALMPIHSGNDVYRIRYDPLSINAKYAEHSWEMELKAGAPMKHRARRVVSI